MRSIVQRRHVHSSGCVAKPSVMNKFSSMYEKYMECEKTKMFVAVFQNTNFSKTLLT